MWLWLYAVRLPAIAAMKLTLDPSAPSGALMSQLPAKVRWKADNYNHLMEQPTVFYALDVYAAWTYVVLRVAHSLVHALANKIELRFGLFVLSNIPLAILTFNAARAVF